MNFVGKLLGFFIGYKFGGFFGAMAGVFIGHWADKKLYELGSVNSSFFKNKLTRQSLFMQTTFAVLGHISKAKGRITQEDIALANNLMSQLQLDDTNRRLAQEAFNRGKESEFPLRAVIREFRLGCGQRADLLRMFLSVQVQAAFSDDDLHNNEKEILRIVAEEMGMSSFQFEQMIMMEMARRQFSSGNFYQQAYQQYQQYQQGGYQQHSGNHSYGGQHGGFRPHSGPTVDDAYKVLGVNASDDQQTVKRAYRRLMNENHPDKLVSKGLPKEMLEMAKEKAQQIQAAYDLICKSKGWK
ncbi:molecular chaperone DjlA [Pasteurellaceae bacterium Pebbles2]|nr:molecular chaperone DjlA [Pasteurellaceae bacterium Pebbles2]